MNRGKWYSTLTGALGIVVMAYASSAGAQLSSAITESDLVRPWEQHLAVLQSVPDSATSAGEAAAAPGFNEALSSLEVKISEFEAEVTELINRLAGDPQFPYVVLDTSTTLSTRLVAVHTAFDAAYAAMGVAARDDARAAQASLDSLREILQKRTPLERDVVNALGSGSRQQIVALATRWWHSEEKAAEVRERVSKLRRQPDSTAGGETKQ